MRAQVLLVAITAWVSTVVAAPPAAAGLSDSGGTTSRASVPAAGEQTNASSGYPLEISPRERTVVAENLLHYRVFRSIACDVCLELVGEVARGTARFQDEVGPEYRSDHYYYVSAVSPSGERPRSNAAYLPGDSTWR